MRKRNFYSKLFRRDIEADESDFTSKVKAELLFRIKELENNDCYCFKCKLELKNYIKYYEKIKSE